MPIYRRSSGTAWVFALVGLVLSSLPAIAADVAPTSSESLLHRVAVFSDDPQTIHDPRHPQSQIGPDRMFAAIGLFWTGHPVPHISGGIIKPFLDMGTAFLVSPCYVLTNYHVVFGNTSIPPNSGEDYSGTFWTSGRKAHAVPVVYGQFYNDEWRDWVLLRLDPDEMHGCLGEDPNVGWTHLAALSPADARDKVLSTAGYPSDKSGFGLWRQDACHLFEQLSGSEDQGLWTTDCATRPRASGSPIFFIENGMLEVTALMHGHLGVVEGDEIFPKWDPARANLAVDMGQIISSEPRILELIDRDIVRFHRTIGLQPTP